MREWPEAVTVAGQIGRTLAGRWIAESERETHPHKCFFYTRPRADYERLLPGRTLREATPRGNHVDVGLDDALVLQLGDGGVRILLHESGGALPPKRHLLLRLEDGSALTVTVAGWGAVRLFDADGYAASQAKEAGPEVRHGGREVRFPGRHVLRLRGVPAYPASRRRRSHDG